MAQHTSLHLERDYDDRYIPYSLSAAFNQSASVVYRDRVVATALQVQYGVIDLVVSQTHDYMNHAQQRSDNIQVDRIHPQLLRPGDSGFYSLSSLLPLLPRHLNGVYTER